MNNNKTQIKPAVKAYPPRRGETAHRLTAEEHRTIARLLKAWGPGPFTLKALFGDQWQFEKRPRWLGRLFRKAVELGLVNGVRWLLRKSDKSNVYEMSATSQVSA